MAFKRSDLAGLGIEADKIQILIDWHSETVKALQAEIEQYKDKADELTKVQEQLKAANDEIETMKKDDYKGKYESDHAELEKTKAAFDKYKGEIAGKETLAKKKEAFKALMSKENLPEKYHVRAMKGVDFDGMELDDKGAIKNAKGYAEGIRSEWGDMIVHTETEGAATPEPPKKVDGGTISKKDILAIKDTAERQKAIAENHELFGF